MNDPETIVCDFCGKPESGPMLMLSCWAVSSGERALLVHGEGGTYWELQTDDQVTFEGSLLHWPDCASMWVAAKLIEVEA